MDLRYFHYNISQLILQLSTPFQLQQSLGPKPPLPAHQIHRYYTRLIFSYVQDIIIKRNNQYNRTTLESIFILFALLDMRSLPA